MADITPLSQLPQGEATSNPVEMISALLDAERVKVTPDKPAPAPTQETEAQPEGEAEDQPGPNAQVEGENAEGETAPEVPTAEIPLDQLEAIELETTYKGNDGKDVTEKLPIKELKAGYMRQQDYQRKTAEVARQREEVGSNVRQATESERLQYSQQLQQLKTALIETVAPELKNVNWNDLAENNTFEYVRLSNRQTQINQALQSIEAKQQEVTAKIEADRRQATNAAAQKTWATLEADIPGWNAETYQKVLKAGEKVGYSTGEVASWLDARAIKLLHIADQYYGLQAGKPAADKKVVNAPKVNIKPGPTSQVPRTVQRQNNALQNLRKSGKVDDLAAFLTASIK